MARFTPHVHFEGLVIPCGAEFGITEQHEDLQSHTAKLTWRGVTRISGPAHRKKMTITLQADSARWGPTFDALEVRDPVVLHSSKWEAGLIPAGFTSVVLRRYPVPDPANPCGFAVHASRAGETEKLPVVVVGKTVSIAGVQGLPVSVQYRSIRPGAVLAIPGTTTNQIEGSQPWSLKLVDLS